MELKDIFDVFSTRGQKVDVFVYTISSGLRNKIFLLCSDVLKNYTRDFFGEIHRMMLFRHGLLQLVQQSKDAIEDISTFLASCKDEYFLDFIEYIFRVNCLRRANVNENKLISDLNLIFASENAGYELTNMVKQEVDKPIPEFGGALHKVIEIVAYPQVIRKDNQVTHANAVVPALQLLMDSKYSLANEEYLQALEHFKKGEYGDCLTKSCSAFESVMKIICTTKGWPYNHADTASSLIHTLILQTHLDTFFEQPLMLIATLRNRLSTAHGAGQQPRPVSTHLACYALNSTASAILFLVNETAQG